MVDFNKIAITRIDNAIKNKSPYLDLSNLFLNDLPENFSQLETLSELDLSRNCFSEFPTVLSKLYNLDFLDLSHNILNDIYFDLGKFYSLRRLDLSYNYFTDIPREIKYLKNIEELNLNGNPFYDQAPEEIVNQGIWAIENYNNELKRSKQIHRLFEAKLLFVGSGDVGKTTLIKVLKNKTVKITVGEEQTTHGININSWNLTTHFPAKEPYYNRFIDEEKLFYYDYETDLDDESDEFDDVLEILPFVKFKYRFNDGYSEYALSSNNIYDYNNNFFVEQNIIVNIWDFGGQEIYHSTHQFFLTKRSVYVFVWEARKDQDEDSFEYWLNIIKYLSNSSPVIIVMNKLDVRLKHIDESALREKYPNIISFHNVSCVTKEGIDEFALSVENTLKDLRHLGDNLPSVWLDLQEYLKNLKKDYIDVDLFYSICRSFRITPPRADYISEYLHDLGKILHFRKDSVLKNILILNPEWATGAVYHLIDNIEIQKNFGRFKTSQLKQIWDTTLYPQNMHYELIKLMEKFELCFNLIGTDEYIIPELLPLNKSKSELEKYNINESLVFEYHYKFIPAGIVNRMICNLFFIIERDYFWKNCVIVKNDLASALIQESRIEKKITIRIIGYNKGSLLGIIRNELKRIHLNLNYSVSLPSVDFVEKIPCSCSICQSNKKPYLFDYNVLLRYLAKGTEYIDCQNSIESMSISKLIEGIKSTQTDIDIISYMCLAASQLQGNYLNIKDSEDSRNSFIATILSNKGVISKDQSRWGKSETGKLQGEIDIKIENNKGLTLSIFEGFNLDYCNKSVINRHIGKIFGYDPNGLRDNFIFVYSETKNFISLFSDYMRLLNEFSFNNYNFEVVEDISSDYILGTEIKIIRSKYYRQKQLCNLYHILINLNFQSGA